MLGNFVYANECLLENQFKQKEEHTIAHILTKTICETTKSINTQAELDEVIKMMLMNQSLNLANISNDRHKIAEHLNDCSPEKDSKALVINFAGTGAFNPRGFDLMTDFMSCFAENKLSEKLNTNVFMTIATIQRKYQPQNYKWSGIEAGPLNLFGSDPYLKKNAKFMDFATFASEESELIADPQKLGWKQLSKIPEEIEKSNAGNPKGISMAIVCIKKYLTAAKKLAIKPKIIVLTHSSGGRSAVKFAENLKSIINPLTNKKDHKIDLVFSMDPVKEAHEAIKEVSTQYAGKAFDRIADYIPFVDTEDKAINVWARKQPLSLYRPTNTSRWVNVYQNKDTEGLKGPIKFGIHGSPVENANNLFITKSIYSDGHGAITTHSETTKLFIQEIKYLIGY